MSVIKLFDLNGVEMDEISVQPQVAERKVRIRNLKAVLDAYQANRRQGNASVKTKSEVAGTGFKQWRQKGTGRARSHYRQSNVWRGGFAPFGPRPRSYRQLVPKKQRQQALLDAWSSKIQSESVKLIKGLVFDEIKTKQIKNVLAAFELNRLVLFVVVKADQNLILSARNLKNVRVREVSDINAEDIILAHHVLISEEAYEAMNQKIEKVNKEDSK